MTPLGQLQRWARDAAASARRNLVPGTVKAVHNGNSDVALLAGSTPGQPLYTVTVIGRRGQAFDVFPVASSIPVQVGHRVFVSLLDGDLHRGAWITGTLSPPVPQVQADTVDINAFGTYVVTGPVLPAPTAANRIVLVENAFVATAARMAISFSLELPAAPGQHDVDQETSGSTTTRTGAYSGVTVQWEVSALLLDSDGDTLGVATHGFLGQGAVTGVERITPNPAGLDSRWRFSEQLLTPTAEWSGVFDTHEVIGDAVALEMYLVGSFVNDAEYSLPADWGFSSNQVRYSAVEQGAGSGLPG